MAGNEDSFEEEILSPEQHYNEYVMTSLRTSKGCNSMKILDRFGNAFYYHFLSEIQKSISQEFVYESNKVFFSNPKRTNTC